MNENILKISSLFIYPIKSLGGSKVNFANVTDRGFEFDRRWMLVDEHGHFLSQRSKPQMALLQTSIESGILSVFHKHDESRKIEIPITFDEQPEKVESVVWDDKVETVKYDRSINDWFSNVLDTKCRLVYMPDNSRRKVDTAYAANGEITSLSDGYPFLIIGEESLNSLNRKLSSPVTMERFRPNLVFYGGKPHYEDNWDEFKINGIKFIAVKPCARCVVTTIDPETGASGDEPLRTLSEYRKEKGKIMFGQNLLHTGKGTISIGDEIEIISIK